MQANAPRRRRGGGHIPALLMLLASCASPAPTRGKPGLLEFLHAGATTRQDALLQLGEPSASYEGDRILAWRLGRDQAGHCLLGPPTHWEGVSHSLVLAFDDRGVLRRHALVSVQERPECARLVSGPQAGSPRRSAPSSS